MLEMKAFSSSIPMYSINDNALLLLQNMLGSIRTFADSTRPTSKAFKMRSFSLSLRPQLVIPIP